MTNILPRSAFARSVSVLIGGTAGAQLLLVLAAPLLTRLYSPEDFGLLALFSAILSFLVVMCCLRYELSIPQTEKDEDAAAIVVLGLIILLFITLIVGAVTWAFGGLLLELFDLGLLAKYLWLLPVGMFLFGIYQIFYYWSLRLNRFSSITKTKIWQSVVVLSVQLLASKFGAFALIGGQVVGQCAGTTALARGLGFSSLKKVRKNQIRSMAYRYRRYPMFSTWSGLINTAGAQMPTLLLAALFSPMVAGIYALAQRVTAMPLSLIGGAVSNVFLPNAAEAHRSGQLAPLVARVYRALSYIAMPPMLILLLAGPDLFSTIFGEEWRGSGVIAQWLAPMLYMMFVTSPMSTLFGVMDKQAQGLLFQVLLLVGRVSGLLIGALYLDDFTQAIAIFSINSVLCYLAFLTWIVLRSGNSLSMIFVQTIRAFSVSGIAAIPLAIGVFMFSDSFVWLLMLAVTIVLFATIYRSSFREVG